ncbi:TIR-like protein FxsC [Streptomyces sp. 4F14]|uniref:TIR-like protein FxsC n=1 Tax=Streptomyces sp. 4F14 TaxID=3394380 RepID=UPI003A8AB963
MIDLLHAALAAAGYDATPEELADILWLAAHPRTPFQGLAASADGAVPTGGARASGRERGGRGPDDSGPAAARTLYAAADWSDGAATAVSPTRLPTPRALPDARALARSLRPLRSSVRSRTALRLDVRATVTAIADGFRDVVLAPAREPLLDLTLVVDDGVSMAVWHDAARELHQELHRLRAFRRIRLLGMDTDDPAGPRVTAEPYRQGAPPAHPGPGERTLLVVLTDGVGYQWRTGAVQRAVTGWALKGPTAVFHVLPVETWAGTGLPTVRLMASAARAAVANHQLRVRHPKLGRGVLPVPETPVPVVDVMRGTSTRAWARLVGAPAGEVALHFYDAGQLEVVAGGEVAGVAGWGDRAGLGGRGGADGLGGRGGGEGVEGRGEAHGVAAALGESVEDALEDFLSGASDEARRLAAHLACAGTALTVPLMRLVQRSAVPDSGPEHLAEVFLSGMLAPYAPVLPDGADPLPHEALPWNRRAFTYPPEVAEVLRELVRRSEERATRDQVTRYLAGRHPSDGDGAAVVADPQGALRARGDLPLGRMGARWTQGAGRQVSLGSLVRALEGVVEALGVPPLDWVEEAVGQGVVGVQRVAELLVRAGEVRGAEDEVRGVLVELAEEAGRPELAVQYRSARKARIPTPSSGQPYFFLSYPHLHLRDHSDPNIWVQRLFHDLTGHIRNLTVVEPGTAGFMDQSITAGRIWSDEVADALANCRVFVPLLSPRYFASSWCGREWWAFMQRKARWRNGQPGWASAIVPALWTPVPPRQIPRVVSEVQSIGPELPRRYQEYGLYGLIKLTSFRNTYERVVLELARRIVDMAENTRLEPGVRMDLADIPNAFGSPARTEDPPDTAPTPPA